MSTRLTYRCVCCLRRSELRMAQALIICDTYRDGGGYRH